MKVSANLFWHCPFNWKYLGEMLEYPVWDPIPAIIAEHIVAVRSHIVQTGESKPV